MSQNPLSNTSKPLFAALKKSMRRLLERFNFFEFRYTFTQKYSKRGRNMNKEYILDFLKTHKQELQHRFSLTKIGLFGSYAKDTATENSDIDIVIESKKKDFFLREDLKEYLEANFKTPVDVGYLDSIREYYKTKIEQDIIYV